MELFEGGVLAADVTDSSCSNSNFTTSGIVSRFESGRGSRATFGVGDLGWKGYIDFKEGSSTGDNEIGFQVWDTDGHNFGIEIFFTSCSSISNAPSISYNPTSSPQPTVQGPNIYLNITVVIEVDSIVVPEDSTDFEDTLETAYEGFVPSNSKISEFSVQVAAQRGRIVLSRK